MKHLTDTIRDGLRYGSLMEQKQAAFKALSELERMAGEPFAHFVYFPDQQRGEFAHDLDELCEDMTNDENNEVTILFAAPPAQQPQVRPDFSDEWTGYLKGGETPFERFLRERKDLGALTKLYQRALEENERLKAQQPQEIEVVCPVCSHTFYAWPGEHKVQQPQAEAVPEMHDALCPALTGGDCTCTPPATIDKVWAQFCGGIGRGPDAPYPGMIEAFESHYGQTFTDKDWREETGVWAAAWKAAKAHGEAAPQQAETVPSDVVRDAERYRWLRNESWAGYNTGKGTPSVYTVDGAGNRRMMLAEEAMDAAIDAAIAAQGEKP